jgi:hypothetical protein
MKIEIDGTLLLKHGIKDAELYLKELIAFDEYIREANPDLYHQAWNFVEGDNDE